MNQSHFTISVRLPVLNPAQVFTVLIPTLCEVSGAGVVFRFSILHARPDDHLDRAPRIVRPGEQKVSAALFLGGI